MEKITRNLERKEKPEKLYMGSSSRGIKEIIPQSRRNRKANEDPVIFSTPSKALASIFLIENHNSSWMDIGFFNDVPYTVICMNREDFIKRDKGGSLYEVSSDTFDFNPNLGMGEKEWTSKTPIKPSKEIDCSSALDEMINNGVYVFFVDKETFRKIQESKDHGFEIISEIVSENTHRNPNIKTFRQATESE